MWKPALYGGVFGEADVVVKALAGGRFSCNLEVHCDYHRHEGGSIIVEIMDAGATAAIISYPQEGSMDINKLKAFICVAKHQNFTKASEELFISQPALSKKIADFEKEINVQLLMRNNRNVTLTPAGIALYNEAPTILNIMDDLTQKVQRISRNPNRRLSIACSGTECDRFIPLIYEFQQMYPDIDISLRWCSALVLKQMLLTNTIDFGFQLNIEAVLEENVDSMFFCNDRLDMIVSNYHPLAAASSVRLEELAGERFIAIKSSMTHVPYNHLLEFLDKNEITFEKGISCVDTIDTLVLQVSAGQGVAALSHQSEKMYGQRVHFLSIDGDNIELETDLVWNINNTNPTRDLLIDFVKQKNL